MTKPKLTERQQMLAESIYETVTAYSGGSGHPFRQHPATCSGVSGHL